MFNHPQASTRAYEKKQKPSQNADKPQNFLLKLVLCFKSSRKKKIVLQRQRKQQYISKGKFVKLLLSSGKNNSFQNLKQQET